MCLLSSMCAGWVKFRCVLLSGLRGERREGQATMQGLLCSRSEERWCYATVPLFNATPRSDFSAGVGLLTVRCVRDITALCRANRSYPHLLPKWSPCVLPSRLCTPLDVASLSQHLSHMPRKSSLGRLIRTHPRGIRRMRRKIKYRSQVLAQLLHDLSSHLRRQCRLRLEKLWIMRHVLHHDLQLLQLDTAHRTLHMTPVFCCGGDALLSPAELLTLLKQDFRFDPFQQLIVRAVPGHDLGEDRCRLPREDGETD